MDGVVVALDTAGTLRVSFANGRVLDVDPADVALPIHGTFPEPVGQGPARSATRRLRPRTTQHQVLSTDATPGHACGSPSARREP